MNNFDRLKLTNVDEFINVVGVDTWEHGLCHMVNIQNAHCNQNHPCYEGHSCHECVKEWLNEEVADV